MSIIAFVTQQISPSADAVSLHELRLVPDDVATRVLVVALALSKSRPQIVATPNLDDDGRKI